MSRRVLLWLGSSRRDLRTFPASARRRAGHELDLLQQGLDATDCKPLPTVGSGVYELRVRAEGAFRVFYIVKFTEAIYVLHAFEKKTRKTAGLDIEIGIKRYRRLLHQRRKS